MLNYTDSKNKELNQIKNLKWLPWVGKSFENNQRRLLIIGESHYAQGNDFDSFKKDLDLVNEPNFTKNSIQQTQIEKHYQLKPIDNLLKALYPNDNINVEKFWENVAFYNFIQRPMHGIEDRPTNQDFDLGWDVFSEIIKVLQPTDCIFIGVKAAESVERMMDTLKVKRENRIYFEKIGGVIPAGIRIFNPNQPIDISFIRHSSAHFSPPNWHPFITSRHQQVINELKTKI